MTKTIPGGFHTDGECTVAAGDVDGDADIDVIGCWLYHNDGSGWFIRDTESGYTPPEYRSVDGSLGHSGEKALVDVDGDGDLDIVVASAHVVQCGVGTFGWPHPHCFFV